MSPRTSQAPSWTPAASTTLFNAERIFRRACPRPAFARACPCDNATQAQTVRPRPHRRPCPLLRPPRPPLRIPTIHPALEPTRTQNGPYRRPPPVLDPPVRLQAHPDSPSASLTPAFPDTPHLADVPCPVAPLRITTSQTTSQRHPGQRHASSTCPAVAPPALSLAKPGPTNRARPRSASLANSTTLLGPARPVARRATPTRADYPSRDDPPSLLAAPIPTDLAAAQRPLARPVPADEPNHLQPCPPDEPRSSRVRPSRSDDPCLAVSSSSPRYATAPGKPRPVCPRPSTSTKLSSPRQRFPTPTTLSRSRHVSSERSDDPNPCHSRPPMSHLSDAPNLTRPSSSLIAATARASPGPAPLLSKQPAPTVLAIAKAGLAPSRLPD